MNKIIGYTSGVFDLFHIGHLNILKRAKQNCDYLIVSVSTDELVRQEKKAKLIIPFEERMEIVRSIKYVDEAIPQLSYDKLEAWRVLEFHKIFVGDDWKDTKRWNALDIEFKKLNVEVIYLPYTRHISSTRIKKIIAP